MKEIRLRMAAASDLDAIVALDRATDLAPHWPRSAYSAILDRSDPMGCLIVAERTSSSDHSRTLAGFAAGRIDPPPQAHDCFKRMAELEDVVVATICRRAGIGRALCFAVLDWCGVQGADGIHLEVRAASSGAIALYTSLGFAVSGFRRGYYSSPDDDAVTMHLRF